MSYQKKIVTRYNNVLDILQEVGIQQSDDIVKVRSFGDYFNARFVTSGSYDWVGDIFEEIEHMYSLVLRSHEEIDPPRIVVETPDIWAETPDRFELRAKYSCLFPKRTLFLSYQFIYWEDIDEFWIPFDFIFFAKTLDPVLRAGLATLLPSRINYKDKDFISFDKYSTYYYRERGNIVQVPRSGHGYHKLQTEIAQKSWTRAGMDVQLMKIPWLLGVRIEDYVEIIQNNPEEFELYANRLGKLLNNQSESTDILVEWIREVSYGVNRLESIFKKKKRELKFKGIDVAIGLVFSIGTFLLPETIATLKPYLTTLFSSRTAYDGFKWLYEFKQAKELLRDDDFWIIWELKHKRGGRNEVSENICGNSDLK